MTATPEPKALHAVPGPKRLSMAEQIALQSLMAEVARAQQRVRDLFAEIGLDPAKQYRLEADGAVVEAS